MEEIVKLKTKDGDSVEFVNKIIGSGTMKDVYFSPDRSYVIAFYKNKLDSNSKHRLEKLVGPYRKGIFENEAGDYWYNLYCWPTAIVEHNGKTGIVCPTYQNRFFFSHGSVNNDFLGIKGKEKEGKWFASALHMNRSIAEKEKGDWMKMLLLCLKISRGVRRLHSAGLAHSDLSYKNVLVDPSTGSASIIDIDGLVVPGIFPPDVLGTPDFIAPEVLATSRLPMNDPKRYLPSQKTDRHALAILIYMYLLQRHPLRGKKVNDLDPKQDEFLSMGGKALFVEHPNDQSNRININDVKPSQLPQADTAKFPYKILGPYLAPLVKMAFIDGLHSPDKRPFPNDWEFALTRTIDLLLPCSNPACRNKWFVFDNTMKPVCHFCGTAYKDSLPVLNFYTKRNNENTFSSENYRLMVYDRQYLHQWHVFKNITPNEKLTEQQRQPVGYFARHENKWLFFNLTLTEMRNISNKTHIPVKTMIELKDGQQLLLSPKPDGRLLSIQISNK